LLVEVPGGRFVMGDPEGEPGEAPKEVEVAGFSLMRYEVTNAQFRAFVAATGHRTDPERKGRGLVWSGKWQPVDGANWRHPRGPRTSIAGLDDHPVVQVSVEDARAFCAHYGLRLPTEAEWELAARGTRDQRRYPWGMDAPVQGASARANFGTVSCCAASPADGFEYTAPVGSFPAGASPYGIHDMAGNVWEWTADSFLGRQGTAALRGGGWGNDPYCLRVSYRHGNRRDVGRDHIGIRCAGDVPGFDAGTPAADAGTPAADAGHDAAVPARPTVVDGGTAATP
jgi:formylglycine-generating enzyme required for sulfatase activity